ncbi:MAG: hypothetical protein HBSAPP03_11270 [Phycisphaerae bacterium]|nr:MAG: hypothetical protein HBSAPP03_11270 [Phycisphaerae bacterium]
MTIRSLLATIVGLCVSSTHAQPPTTNPPAHNVILVMIDGLRWQEVFRGAERALISKEHGKVEKEQPVLDAYWRDSPEERRQALLPFLWGIVARQGVILGNRDRGSLGRTENPHWFSYPGYSEVLCGFPDDRIDSNRKVPNPNTTVFEWLNAKEPYRGRVAGFGGWDVFPFILNTMRSGIPVDDSIVPFTAGTITPGLETINKVKTEIPRRWASANFDAIVFRTAMEWIPANTPRVVFLGQGETDEWAHEGDYEQYLRAARRVDGFLAELWAFLQHHEFYRGRTAMLITCDHGRGDGAVFPEKGMKDWNNHGAKHPGSDQVWLAAIGAGIPSTGEASDGEFTLAQTAATLAHLLGEDWNAAEPRAARPLGTIVWATTPVTP